MFDTVKLRFHGILDTYDDTLSIIHNKNKNVSNYVVPEHNELYKKLLEFKHKYFSITKVYNEITNTLEVVDSDEFLRLENSQHLQHHELRKNIIRFQDGNRVKERNMRVNGSYRISSSDPNVSFSINESGSFIDFEFSIPKYLYGHNLAQFLPQGGSKLNYDYDLINFKDQTKILYKRFMNFIQTFLSDLCKHFKIDMLPNMNYIEVRRLDLCYNQYFQSKEDALEYLEHQRKLNMHRQRRTSNIAKSYDTSISYITSKGSYFKIYHKGSEYSKTQGDLKKHMQINREFIDGQPKNEKHQEIYKPNRDMLFRIFEDSAKGNETNLDPIFKAKVKDTVNLMAKKMPFKVHFLKQEMDKVLRYEVSLSSNFFKYLYKTKVFRRNCPEHNRANKLYKKVKSIYMSDTKDPTRVAKWELRHYKNYHKYMGRSVFLMLETNSILKRFEKVGNMDLNPNTKDYIVTNCSPNHTILNGKDIATFTDFFLRHCVSHFKSLINQYQIKQIEKYDNIASKIRQYNLDAQKRINQYNTLNAYKLIRPNNKPFIKNGKVIKKAINLLTYTERRKRGLKKVNANILLMLVNELISKNQSLDQFFKKAGTNKSTFHRYKKDLELFDIHFNTLNTKKEINVRTDFFDYYNTTGNIFYRDKFYLTQNHYNND